MAQQSSISARKADHLELCASAGLQADAAK
jgi:hypothetical protein